MFDDLLKGFIIGFSIAAPVGPIGVLCIRKTLEFGRLAGLISGLGAAVADMIYGAIGFFGLKVVSDFLLSGQFWLRILGGGFLLYLGLKTFVTKPKVSFHKITPQPLTYHFLTTFFLTMTNPLTILTFLALFASFGPHGGKLDYSRAFWLVLGVLIGSSLWWAILTKGISLFRKRIEPKTMIWINRAAGIIIFGFGVATYLTLL